MCKLFSLSLNNMACESVCVCVCVCEGGRCVRGMVGCLSATKINYSDNSINFKMMSTNLSEMADLYSQV